MNLPRVDVVGTLTPRTERGKTSCHSKVHRLKRRVLKPLLPKAAVKMPTSPKKYTVKRKLMDLQTRLSEFLSGTQLHFVMSQLRCATRKVKAYRWSSKDKAFALSLMHSSPKAYRLLRKVFAMPSIKTLKAAMHNMQIYPGFNDSILEALRMKTDGLPQSSKMVVVAMDEMSIKEGLSFDKGRDQVEGFVEGFKKTKELANHAIVFMARGVIEKWKQPIGYFLSSGPMNGSEMKELVISCVDKLAEIGLTVVLFVCDQGTNNQNLFQSELGVREDEPYFVHKGSKIFMMYDPPHLLKNMRNNLKNHGFMIDDHEVIWRHVSDFFDADSSKPIRMAPRLSRKHIDLPPFAALRVSLAAQVFSHSVSSGMAQWNIITEDAKHTADFRDRMDKLFNAFNSRTVDSVAPMRHAFSGDSGHKEFLTETLSWLKNIKSKGKRQPACLKGWRMAIQCLLQLWETLHQNYQVKFLLTNRFNQDCVENLFSIVRAKGGQRDNPDAGQFRMAFAQLELQVMVDSVMLPSTNTNCQEDIDHFLLTLGSLDRKEPLQSCVASPSPYDLMRQQLPENVKSLLSVCTLPSLPPEDTDPLSKQETNILAYMSGYIFRKLRNIVCESCRSNIINSDCGENEDLEFVKHKKYSAAKDGLISPSTVLLSVVSELEMEYRKIVDDILYSEQVKATLVSTLSKKGVLGRCVL